MKLVIMTKSTFFVEEDNILTTLFDEGMDKLHLYKPGSQLVFSDTMIKLWCTNIIDLKTNTTWLGYI